MNRCYWLGMMASVSELANAPFEVVGGLAVAGLALGPATLNGSPHYVDGQLRSQETPARPSEPETKARAQLRQRLGANTATSSSSLLTRCSPMSILLCCSLDLTELS